MQVINSFFKSLVTQAQSRNETREARRVEREKFSALCKTQCKTIVHVHLVGASAMPHGKLDRAEKSAWLEKLASESVQFSFHWQGRANRAHWKALSCMHAKAKGIARENVSAYKALPRLAVQYGGAWHRFIFMLDAATLNAHWQEKQAIMRQVKAENRAIYGHFDGQNMVKPNYFFFPEIGRHITQETAENERLASGITLPIGKLANAIGCDWRKGKRQAFKPEFDQDILSNARYVKSKDIQLIAWREAYARDCENLCTVKGKRK